MSDDARLARLIDCFESITPHSLQRLAEIYTDDVYFKDPFNEVRGITAVMRIFSHMFEQVDMPRFVIASHVLQDDEAFVTWEFRFRMKRFARDEQCIRGASHLKFAADGRASFHRDYWDAAEELYEKLPVLGALMRALKRAARA